VVPRSTLTLVSGLAMGSMATPKMLWWLASAIVVVLVHFARSGARTKTFASPGALKKSGMVAVVVSVVASEWVSVIFTIVPPSAPWKNRKSFEYVADGTGNVNV